MVNLEAARRAWLQDAVDSGIRASTVFTDLAMLGGVRGWQGSDSQILGAPDEWFALTRASVKRDSS